MTPPVNDIKTPAEDQLAAEWARVAQLKASDKPQEEVQWVDQDRDLLRFSPLFFFLTSLFTYISLDIFSLYWFYSYMITHPQYAY